MFQRTIATGRWTLATVCVVASVLWVLRWRWTGETAISHFGGLALTGLSVYFLTELNNAYALLRRGSRLMCSCLFLLACADSVLHSFSLTNVALICGILFYFPLLSTYMRPQTPVQTFCAYLLLSCGTLCEPCWLWLIPVAWIAQVILMSLSFRSFVASLYGVSVPWLLYLTVAYVTNSVDIFLSQISKARLSAFQIPTDIPPQEWALTGFCLLLFLVGTVDFLCTRHLDKTRTRYSYFAILLIGMAEFLYVGLQPQRLSELLPLCILSAAMMASHFVSITFSRWKNLASIVFSLLLLGMCVWSVFQ